MRLEPESVLRKLQKKVREEVLWRDLDTCIFCGTKEGVEAAHIIPPPINYFLSHAYARPEQLEAEAAPFYRPENVVLLCRKCHMMLDYPYLLEEFAAKHGRRKAEELVTKALILAGVSLEDLKSGGNKRVMQCAIERMFDIYGRGYKEIIEGLEKVRQERSLQRT